MDSNLPPVYGNAPVVTGSSQAQPVTPPPPPPAFTPPPLSAPPPVPPSRWNLWRIAIIALAVMIALGYMAYSMVQAFSFGPQLDANNSPNRGLYEITVENNRSDHKIAVIEISGMIASEVWDRTGRPMVTGVRDQLEVIKNDDEIKAVILKVDSPGGEVLASDDIYRLIADFQKTSDIPVIASMGSLAASGGYYVAAPCQWIVANELTITGSIGVIMHSFNYRGLMDKVGVAPVVFKSGKFKDMLSPDRKESDIPPEERKMVQEVIDDTFNKFKQVVSEGRQRAWTANQKNKDKGRELAQGWEDFADGRILTGKQAYQHGFVDEMGNFRTAVERAQKIAGITKANLIRYEHPFDLAHVFRMLGKSQTPAIKIDLGIDLPKLKVGMLYFLSSSVLH